ncbi:hypothetical protein Ciccas_007533 [Cichlidogyrus casuarinus]|uniref:BZIP domain-containing protein n=1 Tax=Cichlidogyrus casuarinus TaxID=1844966 RepID=A0ABD2Q2L3_9PLAT
MEEESWRSRVGRGACPETTDLVDLGWEETCTLLEKISQEESDAPSGLDLNTMLLDLLEKDSHHSPLLADQPTYDEPSWLPDNNTTTPETGCPSDGLVNSLNLIITVEKSYPDDKVVRKVEQISSLDQLESMTSSTSFPLDATEDQFTFDINSLQLMDLETTECNFVNADLPLDASSPVFLVGNDVPEETLMPQYLIDLEVEDRLQFLLDDCDEVNSVAASDSPYDPARMDGSPYFLAEHEQELGIEVLGLQRVHPPHSEPVFATNSTTMVPAVQRKTSSKRTRADKEIEKRMRNNEASRRSRAAKKARLQEMAFELDELQRDNEKMQDLIKLITKTVDETRVLLRI